MKADFWSEVFRVFFGLLAIWLGVKLLLWGWREVGWWMVPGIAIAALIIAARCGYLRGFFSSEAD